MLRPGLAALDNLADKFVADWKGRQLAGKKEDATVAKTALLSFLSIIQLSEGSDTSRFYVRDSGINVILESTRDSMILLVIL